MLLPLFGLVMGCVVFTIIGSIVLSYFFKLPHTFPNLFVFVIGAFPGALGLGFFDGWLFEDARHFLNSGIAIFGFFTALLVGAIVGGSASVWLKTRLAKRSG